MTNKIICVTAEQSNNDSGIVGYKGTHFVSARINKMLGIEEEKHLE